jgi:tRNA threonylcarbamoyl adenosine modification protein YeaZ
MLLAIDTSTDNAAIALAPADGTLIEMVWRCERNHTVELLPHVSALLAESGVSVKSLRGIIVAIGPGGFNGTRAGVATAKGLAFSLDIPVVGISSLEAVAYEHATIGLPVCPVFNAGRGEVATALFRQSHGVWSRLELERIATLEELAASIKEKTVFCGEYIPAVAAELKQRLGEMAEIAAGEPARARMLAELGRARLAAGSDSPAGLQPLYLRRPSISQPKHR